MLEVKAILHAHWYTLELSLKTSEGEHTHNNLRDFTERSHTNWVNKSLEHRAFEGQKQPSHQTNLETIEVMKMCDDCMQRPKFAMSIDIASEQNDGGSLSVGLLLFPQLLEMGSSTFVDTVKVPKG